MSVLVNRINKTGVVYVMAFEIDEVGGICYKIGLTRREEVVDRLGEICLSFFNVFRYIPRCHLVKFSKCDNPLKVEMDLHKFFSSNKVRFVKKFNGSTEFFSSLDIEELKRVYKDAIDGKDINVDTYKNDA